MDITEKPYFTPLLDLQSELQAKLKTRDVANFNETEVQQRLREITPIVLEDLPADKAYALLKIKLRINVLIKTIEECKNGQFFPCLHEIVEINTEIHLLNRLARLKSNATKDDLRMAESKSQALKESILSLSLPKETEIAFIEWLERTVNLFRNRQSLSNTTVTNKFKSTFRPACDELKFSPKTATDYDQVEALDVSFSYWTDLRNIIKFTNLRKLTIRGTLYNLPIDVLKQIPKLKMVDCYEVKSTQVGFQLHIKSMEEKITVSTTDGSPSLIGKEISVSKTFLILDDEQTAASQNSENAPPSHIPIECIPPSWWYRPPAPPAPIQSIPAVVQQPITSVWEYQQPGFMERLCIWLIQSVGVRLSGH